MSCSNVMKKRVFRQTRRTDDQAPMRRASRRQRKGYRIRTSQSWVERQELHGVDGWHGVAWVYCVGSHCQRLDCLNLLHPFAAPASSLCSSTVRQQAPLMRSRVLERTSQLTQVLLERGSHQQPPPKLIGQEVSVARWSSFSSQSTVNCRPVLWVLLRRKFLLFFFDSLSPAFPLTEFPTNTFQMLAAAWRTLDAQARTE